MSIYPYNKNCEHCEKEFVIKHASVRDQRFCSIQCVAISKTKYEKLKNCLTCNRTILSTHAKKFCSQSCSAIYTNKNMHTSSRQKQSITLKSKTPEIERLNFEKYRRVCRFILDENILKCIDGYELYKNLGIYHHKNNKNGIQLDHMLSVKEGFNRQLSTDIVNHPANAKFVTQAYNSSKSAKSDITVDKLRSKIKNWNNLRGMESIDYLFDIKINTSQSNKKRKNSSTTGPFCEVKFSSITGNVYNTKLKPAKGWDNPYMVSAKLLAKVFNFELGYPKTSLKNILNSIELLKYHVHIEQMNASQIKRMYNIQYTNFDVFLKNIGVI